MKKRIVAVLLLLPSPWCLADWNDPQIIKALYPQGNADEVIIVQPNYNGSGCSGPNGKFFLLTGHANFKAIYALLLAAHTAGTPVNVHVQDGFCSTSGYSRITVAISGEF